MSEAISVLEQAWAIAYKEVGKEGAEVATIDMITGMFCSNTTGLCACSTASTHCEICLRHGWVTKLCWHACLQAAAPVVASWRSSVFSRAVRAACGLCKLLNMWWLLVPAGNASVFKAGIEKNAQRRAAQAEYAAQAEAAKKAGVMGKAKGVFSTATGGLLGSSSKSSGGGLPPNGIGEYPCSAGQSAVYT